MIRTPQSATSTVVNQQLATAVHNLLYCVRTPVPQGMMMMIFYFAATL
jgi:hypothetical protein